MPNNGIVSKKTNIPLEFRAISTGEFDTATDMVVISQPTTGINVTQSAVTIDQLGELVSASQTPSNFDVATSGNIIISKNEGVYGEGPENIETGDLLTISNVEIPQGLTWRGEYSGTEEYSNSDVVYSIVSTTYTTWVYINENPSTGQALPTSPSTFNTYWAQLGTQGPAGSNGVTAVNGLTGNVTVANNLTEYSGSSWYLNPVIDGNTVKLGINKPFVEFSTRWSMNGSSSLPNTDQIINNSAVNEFGFTSSNISISLDSPGQATIGFPSNTFSIFSGKNIITVSQDNDFQFDQNIIWAVKFYRLSNNVKYKVFLWDTASSTWISNFTQSITLRLTIRRYN
jgi:hypothetical protein